jgi:hypothetical protein
LKFEDAGISKENGYILFVIPNEKGMVEFGIDTEKFGLGMNVN